MKSQHNPQRTLPFVYPLRPPATSLLQQKKRHRVSIQLQSTPESTILAGKDGGKDIDASQLMNWNFIGLLSLSLQLFK